MSSFKYWVLKDAPSFEAPFFAHVRVVWPSTKEFFGVYDFVGSPNPDAVKTAGLEDYVIETDLAEEYMIRVLASKQMIDRFMRNFPNKIWLLDPLKTRAQESTIQHVAYPWDITFDNLTAIVNK